MKKVISSLLACLILLSLVGCGGTAAKPDDTVKGFMEAAKTFDFEKMATYINPDNIGDLDAVSSDINTNESEKYFMDYLKDQAAKMSYEIKSSQTDGDSATVTVSCKYIDGTPLLKETISEYFVQAFAKAFSGTEFTDEDSNNLMKDIMAEKQKSIEDTYIEKDVDIKCVKISDKWLIDSVGEDIGNVITANFIAAANEISSAFNGTAESDTASAEQIKQIGSGDVGNFSVSITGYKLIKDYDGNPAVVITYDWTNNSEETSNFMSSLSTQTFQNGIECESAFIVGDSDYDSEASMKDIKPGITLTVQEAFELQDTENPIEVEVSEFMTFDSNPPIITQTFEIK